MKKNNTIKEILNTILKAKNPVFICHQNPDGDTYGAAFGLRKGLNLDDKDIICATGISMMFKELGISNTKNKLEKDYDLYVFLDCAQEEMTGTVYNDIPEDAILINIDHHKTNTYYGTLNLVDDKAAATCEIIFSILEEGNIFISDKTSQYLYMGLVTDTGQFAYGYTTSKSHIIAAKLIDCGADFEKIQKIFFKTIDLKTLLLKEMMIKSLDIVDGKIAIAYLTLNDFKIVDADYEHAGSLISDIIEIHGVLISILIKQQAEKLCKISFRSVKGVDVSKLAMKFGGGGHVQASGCTIAHDALTSKKMIIAAISEMEI